MHEWFTRRTSLTGEKEEDAPSVHTTALARRSAQPNNAVYNHSARCTQLISITGLLELGTSTVMIVAAAAASERRALHSGMWIHMHS